MLDADDDPLPELERSGAAAVFPAGGPFFFSAFALSSIAFPSVTSPPSKGFPSSFACSCCAYLASEGGEEKRRGEDSGTKKTRIE
jgi:hypothetical protein